MDENNKVHKFLIKKRSPRIRGLGLSVLVYLTWYYKKKRTYWR